MIKVKRNNILFLLVLALSLNVVFAANGQSEVGVEEKIGAQLPMDAEFVTSEFDTVKLSDVIRKPTLIAFVYYECPGICSPLLTDIARVAELIDLTPGEDFQIISLSFDHRETPEIAAKWKNSYFDGMKGKFPDKDWTFLTGDSANIKKVTDAVGFNFKPSDDGNYIHADLVLSVSPSGKASRYIYGIKFNQFDLKMALLEAEAGKSSPAVTKFLQYCFSYDPQGQSYTLNITRIFGTIILLGVVIFAGFLTIRKKKVKGN